jgi:hypothetical protein
VLLTQARTVACSACKISRVKGTRLLHHATSSQLLPCPCRPSLALCGCIHPQGTVGAGLPIIGTLKHLLETGDKAQLVEGIFSGTLSYIFNTFGDGRPFSEIVKDAKAQVGRDCCLQLLMLLQLSKVQCF